MKKEVLWIIYFIMYFNLLVGQEDYELYSPGFTSGKYNEFAPVIYKDGVIFCSDKNFQGLISLKDSASRNLVHLYFSSKKEDKWSTPKLFAKELFSFSHDGPITFSIDGKEMFITRSINTSLLKWGSKQEKFSTLGLFSFILKEDKWIGKNPFPYNNKKYNVMHPSLSKDGKYIYFSSNMPGGYGGYDLYSCKRNDENWLAPVNMGSMINTPGNEVFPFIHDDKLYFSSDGREGIGKLDIFFSRKEDSSWTEPELLPLPFNSKSDDFSFYKIENAEQGYFTSNRNNS
ncbi:MAG: hypothetical protein ACOCVN_03495, partial [bacterium]